MTSFIPPNLLADKYIGLALAISSSLLIGTSFIITKKGLNDAAQRKNDSGLASEDLAYLRNPIWWAGTSLMVVGEIANFAAYSFAPPILITPLGFLSVLIGAVLASIFLDEELGHIGRIGCSLCILGAIIIVAHAPPDQEITTVDQILFYAYQPGFLLYCFTVAIFTFAMVYYVAPRYGTRTPVIYISICSLVGSVSVMAAKGLGIALKLTFAGNNQLTHASTYVFGIACAVCIVVQMTYFNKALDTFSTNVVNPIYYVTFTTATIVASLILFQGFNTTDAVNTISLIDGFLVTFFGVHLLNSSLSPRDEIPEGHLPLENGILAPRISLSGRLSSDGWHSGHRRTGSRGFSRDSIISPHTPHHPSRSLAHGRPPTSASSTLFNAYEEDELENGAMVLNSLREVDEEEYVSGDENSNELTRLRSSNGYSGSRPHSKSPISRSPLRSPVADRRPSTPRTQSGR